MTELLQIEAQVHEIFPRAMRHYLEGSGERAYDAIELRLLAPEDLAGRSLRLFHRTAAPPHAVFLAGARVRFSMRRELLTGGQQLFTGAAEDVTPIEDPSDRSAAP